MKVRRPRIPARPSRNYQNRLPRPKSHSGSFIWVAAVVVSLGLFAHAELRMLNHAASAQRHSVVVPVRGPVASVDSQKSCIEHLVHSALEPSPYADLKILRVEIEPGYLSDSYRFTGWDAAGNEYSGQGYATFSQRTHGSGDATLECSQSSATGPWMLRSLRLGLWRDGSSVWEDRDPIG